MTDADAFFGPDIFSPDYWRVGRTAVEDAVRALIDSAPAVPAPWMVRALEGAVKRAVQDGLSLPDRLVTNWRAGTLPPCAHGACAYDHVTGTVALYLNVNAHDIQRSARHECYHVHAARTGRSKLISLDQEEREARDYADGILEIPGRG